MENYLYILPFKDKNHFKIGISSKNYKRINHLNKIYSIDLDKSLIVTAGTNSTIKILETELLTIFPKLNTYKNTDGFSEIRDIKYLKECVNYIKQKHKNLGLIITPFKELLNTPTYKIKSQKQIINIKTPEIKVDKFRKCFYSLENKITKVINHYNGMYTIYLLVDLEKNENFIWKNLSLRIHKSNIGLFEMSQNKSNVTKLMFDFKTCSIDEGNSIVLYYTRQLITIMNNLH